MAQGSDNFDHWRTNLTFDPVPFEDPDLGVAVHRGVYETAQILYARFEPLVAEHLASSPFAKVAFTVRARGCELRLVAGNARGLYARLRLLRVSRLRNSLFPAPDGT